MSRETALVLSMDAENLLTWVRDYLHHGFLEEPPKRVVLRVIRNERCMSKQMILELMEFFQFEKDSARSINTRVMQPDGKNHLANPANRKPSDPYNLAYGMSITFI